jgi:ABC-2 type transport system permease protein
VKLRAILAQARAELLLTARRGESLLVTMVIPVGILCFFTKVEAVDAGRTPSIDFLVPGVLALAVMSNAMVSLGIATGYERRYGVLKRLRATPLSRGGLLLAKTINVAVVEIVQVVVIAATGLALGWDPSSRVVVAVAVLAVGTVAFAGLGMFFAGMLRAEANLALANGLFLVLLFLGGMAYPLGKLPGALEAVAKALPAAALSETVRSLAEPGRSFAWGEALVLVVWAVVAPLAAASTFSWEE